MIQIDFNLTNHEDLLNFFVTQTESERETPTSIDMNGKGNIEH